MSIGGGQTKQSQESGNRAFGFLQNAYGGQATQGVQSSNALAGLLGVGGDPAASQGAFQNYLNSAGYKFQLGEGQNAITSSNAASGLLNSGSALKRLASYGQGLAGNYLQQYMTQLSGLSNQGQQAGSLIGSAGQFSTGKSSSWNANVGLG